MEQYIPKSALVAWAKETYLCENASMIRKVCYKQLLEHLDTLEVKEVDLEKEVESFAYTLPHSAIGDGEHLGKFDDPKVKEARKHGWSHFWRYNYVKEIAKHFFELGMRVNNPITAADRGTAEEIIINLKRVEQDYRINLTKEIEWVRNQAQKEE